MDENFVSPKNEAGYEKVVKGAMVGIGLIDPYAKTATNAKTVVASEIVELTGEQLAAFEKQQREEIKEIIKKKDEEMKKCAPWDLCLKENLRLIGSLYEAILEGKRNSSSADDEPQRNEGRLEVLADDILHLCGLADRPFKFTAKEYVKFKIAGFECVALAKIYLVKSGTKDLVIIFEDIAGKFGNQGYLGQIVAELLMCYYTNIKKRKEGTNDQTSLVIPDKIYCIRTYLHYMTLFAMDASVKQIEDVCDKGLIPSPKITLNCDVEDPTTKDGYGKGYDLLKQEDRKHVITLIASIRQSILKRIDDEGK